MLFIANKGQWDNAALYTTPMAYGQFYAEQSSIYLLFNNQQDIDKATAHPRPFKAEFKKYSIKSHSIRIRFKNGNTKAVVSGKEQSETYYNYFVGNDERFWKSKVPAFQSIEYANIYYNTHLKYYFDEQGRLKYDFIVMPGGNPQSIQMEYEGHKKITIEKQRLVVKTSINNWVEEKPYAYQIINNQKVEVQCSFYILPETNIVTFKLGDYDTTQSLIIDPVLIFSTYSGSSIDNFGYTATNDALGNMYIGGITRNASNFPNDRYPVTPGAFQQVWGGGIGSWPQFGFPSDVTISKYNPDGSKLLYATYIGGNRNDYPHSIITDKSNNLIVYGSTLSKNFPVTKTAFDTTHNDSFDIFVTKLNIAGTNLIGSTYIGGSGIDGVNNSDSLLMNYADEFRGEIQVTNTDEIIIASSTTSTNFPITTLTLQSNNAGRQDGVLFKLSATLSSLTASTYFGRQDDDAIYSLDIDKLGNIFIAGGTKSNVQWFLPPTQSGSYKGGFSDGFIAKINNNLTVAQSFTFTGTNQYDQNYFVRLDELNRPSVLGQTYGRMLPVNARFHVDSGSLFLTQFNNNLTTILQSTNIGNKKIKNALSPTAFMIDECGNYYASAWGGDVNRQGRFAQLNVSSFLSETNSLPLTADALQTITDNSDFYLFAIRDDFDSLLYASYLGEIGNADHVDGGTSRFDKKGVIYQSICASCDKGLAGNFPTTPNSYSPNNLSPRCSNVGVKLDFRTSNIVRSAFSFAPQTFCLDSYVVVNYTNQSVNGKQFNWYINGVLRGSTRNLRDTIRNSSNYRIKLVAIDSSRCVIIDSTEQQFSTSRISNASFTLRRDTCTPRVFLQNTSTPTNAPFIWYLGDGDTSTQQQITKQFKNNGLYQILLITNPGSLCADSAVFNLNYDSTSHILKARFTATPIVSCAPEDAILVNETANDSSFVWLFNNIPQSITSDTVKIKFAKDSTINVSLIVTNTSSTCLAKDTTQQVLRALNGTQSDFTFEQDTCTNRFSFTNESTSSGGLGLFYIWYFGDGQVSTLPNPVHTYFFNGTYNVSLVTNPGTFCRDSTVKQLVYDSSRFLLKANFFLPDTPLCVPALVVGRDSSINATLNEWRLDGTLVSVSKNFSQLIDAPGEYTLSLTVRNTNTCKKEDRVTKTFKVFPFGKSDFAIARDSCSLFVSFINKSVPGNAAFPINYKWYFGDGDSSTEVNPKHNYKKTDEYTITLIAADGSICADTLTKTFFIDGDTIKDVFIPNVFTPNDDGQNDCYKIYGLSTKCDKLKLSIYNRWGTKYFETEQSEACWNGKNEKGEDATAGVYYYILSYSKTAPVKIEKTERGTITLIRK